MSDNSPRPVLNTGTPPSVAPRGTQGTYSPSSPKIGSDVDWAEFLDFRMFPYDPVHDESLPEPALPNTTDFEALYNSYHASCSVYQVSGPNVSFSNSVATQPAPTPSPPSTTFAQHSATCPTIVPEATEYTVEDWIAFLQSQEYHDWYQRELASGAFDNLACNPTSIPPCTSSSTSGTINPATFINESVNTLNDSLSYPGFTGDAIPSCYDSDSDAASADDDGDEDLVQCKNNGDDHAPDADGGAVRIKVCNGPMPPTAVEAPSPIAIPFINNSDLNDLIILEELASDSSDGHDNGSDEEEDCRPEIQPSDVQRHYWNRTNLKYTVSHDGRNYYMSAEHMHTRFRGVPYALKTYWEDKRPESISAFRIMEYFAAHGHLDPLRTPLYHLLARRLYRMLMEDAKNMFF
ncbi:hypothetical protein QFC20_005482 [Naganishia adeliensis]|uniref:Uncharacterized protein n=1 Tax=Naganishia adeliensis TaxID=92952 RepID=A0ACC2VMX6_9TREE|nr:hypothetical protein QFC20_005482 [Naganishia adeliensis]